MNSRIRALPSVAGGAKVSVRQLKFEVNALSRHSSFLHDGCVMPDYPFEITSPSFSEEFEAYYDLRWRILRRPWKKPRGSEKDDHEDRAIHVTALDQEGRLIGVGRLHRNCATEYQIRYMAIEPDWRGRGVGRAILGRLEALARKEGARSMVLNAREGATKFYERMGYKIRGEGPMLFGEIKHFRMQRSL